MKKMIGWVIDHPHMSRVVNGRVYPTEGIANRYANEQPVRQAFVEVDDAEPE